MNKTIQIIAETAFSHEGDFDFLLNQIHLAKKGKVDYVKFQILLDIDEYFIENYPNKEKIKNWTFSKEQWIKALKLAKLLKMKTIVLPLETTSACFCKENNHLIDAVEIHSVCLNEIEMLSTFYQTNQLVILGIGGHTPQEIEFTLRYLNMPKEQTVLMFGYQSFPTDVSQLNLGKIKHFNEIFNTEIGYADHTSWKSSEFLHLNKYANILGASYFEKHIVVEKGDQRIDFESAINHYDFVLMRKELEELQNILGTYNSFSLNEKEITYKNRGKQIVASKNIKKGQILSKELLCLKISNEIGDFEMIDLNILIGKTTTQNIKKHQVVRFQYIS
jgi:sialic acid synthase SpsE